MLAVVDYSIAPVGLNLLETVETQLDGIAVSLRRISIHVEKILQHQRLGTHNGVSKGFCLILPFLVLHKIDTKEHDNEGYDKCNDDSSYSCLLLARTYGSGHWLLHNLFR